MTKALTVSIVIPVYNEESYIEACLDAIAVQTVLPDEVIVVDNNSTDKTVRLVKKYPFVTLLYESEQGVLYARQTGMNAATSDIIGRIDGDTVLDTDWVHQVKKAFKDPVVSAVTGPNGYYDFIFPRSGLWLEDKLLKGALRLGYEFMFGCNMAIRRSVWQKVAPDMCFDPSIFEDIDVAMHMQEYGMSPVYNPDMTVMVSSRREASNFRDFCHYIHGHTRTYRHHGKRSIATYYAEAWFLFFYLLLKPLHACFDPQLRRPTVAMLLKRGVARPNPMNVSAGE